MMTMMMMKMAMMTKMVMMTKMTMTTKMMMTMTTMMMTMKNNHSLLYKFFKNIILIYKIMNIIQITFICQYIKLYL